MRELVREELVKKEEEFKLQPYERISDRFQLQAMRLDEQGLLNQSMKLKRVEAENHFAPIIEKIQTSNN